jgi:hypothetical protein
MWKHDTRTSVSGVVRVRYRCGTPGCRRHVTVCGQIRDRAAEARRLHDFFTNLAALVPALGVARARDHARATSGVSLATASRAISHGRIPQESRHRGDRWYYAVIESALRSYAASHRKESQHLTPSMPPPPDVSSMDPELLWLLLSRARGIASLVIGLSRPEFGQLAPTAFPSWIDCGARNVDPRRYLFPSSRFRCAATIIDSLPWTVVSEVPSTSWDDHTARAWLSRYTSPSWEEDAAPHRIQEWFEDYFDINGPPFEVHRPPVVESELALDVLRREVLAALRLRAAPRDGDAEAGIGYWLDTGVDGSLMRIRITRRARVIGEAAIKRDATTAANTSKLRVLYQDEGDEVPSLEVGGSAIPQRARGGPNEELADQLV